MQTTQVQAREEEHGSPSWVTIVVAMVLSIALAGPFLHPSIGASAHHATTQVVAAHVP